MKRILLVEDHEQVRVALASDFTQLGYEVRMAANGQEALLALENFQPDVIVLDLRMPIMDGREFAARYHQRTEPQAPIVLLSAEEHVGQLALQINVAAGIVKSADADPLYRTVAKLTQRESNPGKATADSG